MQIVQNKTAARWTVAMFALALLCTAQLSLAGAKKYQVTGVITELTDKTITVQKADGDKWQLDRDDKATVKGDLKVGAKVTIEYTMSAATIEVKPAK